MKEYKLIKKYPSLPTNWEEGMKVGQGDRKNGTYSPCNGKYENNNGIILLLSQCEVENNPEFWEKVIEKEYQILQMKNTAGNFYALEEKEVLGNYELENHTIHSVKRLSDGEVFTAGDKIQTSMTLTINGFIIIDNELLIDPFEIIGTVALNRITKAKQPLFTTEDGVDIFENNKINSVHIKTFELNCGGYIEGIIKKDFIKNSNYKYFSTREAAEEYILMNKPCLSINDIIDVSKSTNTMDMIQNILTKLVKNRL